MPLLLSPRSGRTMQWRRIANHIFRVCLCIAAVFAVTAVLSAVNFIDRPLAAALIFLFIVLIISALWGFRYAVLLSFLAALGFSWLAPPIGFSISDSRDWFVLVAFLVIGIVGSHLSDRARREALNANQRRAEAVAAQRRFQDLVNSVEGIVWEADAETFAFSFVSVQAERILGYPGEQWLGEPSFWKDHIHPDDRDSAVQSWQQATAEKRSQDLEYRMVAADGHVVWIRDLVAVVVDNGHATRLRGVMIDVSRRKRNQEVLRQQASLLDLTHDTIFVRDFNDAITYWNRGAEEFYGWTAKEAIGRVSHELMRTIFPAPLGDIQAELLRNGRWEGELVHTKKFGTRATVASRWSLQRDFKGVPVAILETNNDITERKRAEGALRRSEAYLAEAEKLTHTGSWAWARGAMKPHYWSDEMFRILGVDPREGPPTAETYGQRVHPEDREKMWHLRDETASEKSDYTSEFRAVLPDGTVRHIRTIGHPVLDSNGEIVEYVGTAMDVTERKRAEEERERLGQLEAELAHINRVSMMGELAASLGHEVKQPIAAAITNANTCLRWLKRADPDLGEARDAAARMVEDAMRAVEIINRTSSLYKKGTRQHELVNINEVIREIVGLLRNEAARQGVSVRAELADIPLVTGDRVQLQQVLMNLMINSIDATKDVLGRREVTVSSKCDSGDQLLVSVSDTGVGLPPESDHIFEAFFTTKPHGTGMGLAISRTIIESHGGRLSASSNAGHGATFYFTLPATAAGLRRDE